MEYTVARGTRDLLFKDKKKEKLVCDIIEAIAMSYGFNTIETPMFESTSLFSRSVGESSDIVNKEMYTFLDKGERSITLRPEGTAGAIRLYVNNKLYASPDKPVKLMYCGPVFRYERPQAGRYRQFKQFGFEVIGLKNPYVDVELILMCVNILETLGFENLKIKVNSLGDAASRSAYSQALKDYFKPHLEGENALCEDCKRRWEQNPLRILDCKVDDIHPAVKNAPKIKDYLNNESKEYFKKVLSLLDNMNVSYEVDEGLVRGLDYYSDVVFEIHQEGKSFGALGAGGRYDSLVKEIGGPDEPATGMAFGIDRLVLAMEQDDLFDEIADFDTDVAVIPLGAECKDYAFKTAEFLRKNGFVCEIDFQDKSINAQLKMANRKFAKVAVIIGENEMKSGTFVVKDLEHVKQYESDEANLIECISEILEGECDHHHE